MSAASFKEKGNKHLQKEEYDEAIEAYSQAIALDPNDHVFYSNRSAAFLSKGDAERALEDAESCCETNPTWVKGYSRKGAALHKLKRYDEAKAAYNEGLAISPTDAGCASGLAEVNKVLAGPSQRSSGGGRPGLFSTPEMRMKLAAHPKYGPRLGDPGFEAKLRMCDTNPQFIMQDPEMSELLQILLGGMGREPEDQPFAPTPTPPKAKEPEPVPMEEDISELSEEEKAERARKAEALAAKEEGNALYKAKKFDEAIACYDTAISLDPTNTAFINNKAAVFIEMGNPDGAIELCQGALEIARENRASFDDKAKIYQRMAGAYTKKGDIAEAIEAYNKSLMEKWDKAIERKVKLLQLDLQKLKTKQYENPELALEAKERGNAAFRDGDFGKAILEYEEAVKRDPRSAVLRNNLASAYVKKMLIPDAKKEVDKAIELDPRYVKAWAKKGDIHSLMKEYHKAMEAYRTGLDIEEGNKLCMDGLRKVTALVNAVGGDADMGKQNLNDPEIQAILRDPAINQVLKDMQENPTYAQQAMRNADIRSKIEKLVAAGVLRME